MLCVLRLTRPLEEEQQDQFEVVSEMKFASSGNGRALMFARAHLKATNDVMLAKKLFTSHRIIRCPATHRLHAAAMLSIWPAGGSRIILGSSSYSRQGEDI
jgi:hypothetical protein